MILYTLATDSQRKKITKTAFIYLLLSLFLVLFGAVYEYFSHEVYSYYMLYAFVFPLAGGTLPFFCLAAACCRIPGRITLNLYHSGIATLTVGSLFKGILEIYGTTNRLVLLYWIIGSVFLAAGVISYTVSPE